MSRSASFRSLATLSTCGLMLALLPLSYAAEHRPNVVFFLVDDMGWQAFRGSK